MNVSLKSGAAVSKKTGLLALGVPEGGSWTAELRSLDRAMKGAISALLASGDFAGRHLESALLYGRGIAPKRVLLVGLGPVGQLNAHRLMLAAAQAARRARDLAAGTAALALHGGGDLAPADAARAVAEGAVLGHWRHTAYRRESKPPLDRLEVLAATPAEAKRLAAAVASGVTRAEGVCLARDLANTPGDDLVPSQLAQRATEVGRTAGARVTILDPAAMERLGMGCVLAVGRASVHPPRFIVLDKPPARAPKRGTKARTIVIIGKGVTFDTGGLSLKPREGMSKMKYDMAGSAAVLGLFAALPALDLPVRLVGLIPSAENVVAGNALKPGDVIRALDGTTIEVTNVDAEGRLLLADALGYAKRFDPEAVVDLATLTGAISIALGRHYAGLFTRDDALAGDLISAGEAVGERLWRMPLGDEYLAEMKSDTADLVNSNEKREGASSTAAAFLDHFASGLRWAHLDIASTGWTYTERAHESRGANGFGVRLLLEWLARRAG